MSEEITILADLEAERSVIGGLLVDNGFLDRAGINKDDFFDSTHAAIWQAAGGIIDRGERASVATLAAAFPETQRYIASLPQQANLAALDAAATVRDFAARRKLAEIAAELNERAGDTTVSAAEINADALAKLSAITTGKPAKTTREVAEEILRDLQKPLEIYSTGLAPLDAAMGGGLIAGKLYGIGARKKIGKTMLCGTISTNLNEAGVRHLYVALEMSPAEIEQRNIAHRMGFNAIKFLTRDLPGIENRVAEYAVTAPNFRLYEHAPGASFSALRALIGRNRQAGIKGVIVDYLQLVGGKSSKETEEYHHRQVAQWLADMARQTGLWVLLPCQLNQDMNTRGGEGIKLACDQYYVMHREGEESGGIDFGIGAWLTMEETRYTLYNHVGNATAPALWLHKRGPHFSDQPPYSQERSA